jgi:hypothetical protein
MPRYFAALRAGDFSLASKASQLSAIFSISQTSVLSLAATGSHQRQRLGSRGQVDNAWVHHHSQASNPGAFMADRDPLG